MFSDKDEKLFLKVNELTFISASVLAKIAPPTPCPSVPLVAPVPPTPPTAEFLSNSQSRAVNIPSWM